MTNSLAQDCTRGLNQEESRVKREGEGGEDRDPRVSLRGQRIQGDPPLPQLPGLTCKNASSAIRNGEMMTDTIANWVNSKYVAGPFPCPPLPDFRVNMLMAKEEKLKVRPILNLSALEGGSFNDAIDSTLILKLNMSTAAMFGQKLYHAGKGAKFAKIDLSNAYKLVPVNETEWRCFGFKWLGSFFYETNTVFGNAKAPADFDPLAETIVNVTKTLSNTPDYYVLRQLDDSIVVAPKETTHAETFYRTFKTVCKNLNIVLAADCPKFEKAFGATTMGTVLGIIFDSEKLSWRLSKVKWAETLTLIKHVRESSSCNLKTFQKVHGKLNDFAQLCICLKSFRYHQNKFLKKFAEQETVLLEVPDLVKKELLIWWNLSAAEGLPIPEIMENPPLKHLIFVSDAAGAALMRMEGKLVNISKPGDRGVASVGYKDGVNNFVAILKWPTKFLEKFKCSSMVLEGIGVLLPCICTVYQMN